MKSEPIHALTAETIAPMVHWIRLEKVMLDADLAMLYGVEARVLNQAVKRNLERFPADFMFQVTSEEAEEVRRSRAQSAALNPATDSSPSATSSGSRSQIVILKRGQNIKYLPYAFTEQGVAMLSSVLRSRRAVEVNIAIMRTFVQLLWTAGVGRTPYATGLGLRADPFNPIRTPLPTPTIPSNSICAAPDPFRGQR